MFTRIYYYKHVDGMYQGMYTQKIKNVSTLIQIWMDIDTFLTN